MKLFIALVIGIMLGWYLHGKKVSIQHSIHRQAQHVVSDIVSDVFSDAMTKGTKEISNSVNKVGNNVIDSSFQNVRNVNLLDMIDTGKVIELSERN